MNTDLLKLTQWLSPAFPTGAFAYSHGLEAAVDAGDIAGAEGFATWLRLTLEFGAPFCDAVILGAVRRGEDVGVMADLARALAPSGERLEESLVQGAAFARTLRGQGVEVADYPLPVAVGLASRGLDLADDLVLALYLQGFASNLVQIALRLIPLAQTEGQRILADLTAHCQDLARRAAETRPADITSFVPRGDLAAMRHETQAVRQWRS